MSNFIQNFNNALQSEKLGALDGFWTVWYDVIENVRWDVVRQDMLARRCKRIF